MQLAVAAGLETARTWTTILLRPEAFFDSVRNEARLGPSLAFGFGMALLSSLVVIGFCAIGASPVPYEKIRFLALFAATSMALYPVFAGFLGGAAACAIGRNLGDPRASYKQSVAICCYALAILPVTSMAGSLNYALAPDWNFGPLVWFYFYYIVARGIIVVHRARPLPTFVVVAVLGIGFEIVRTWRAMEQGGLG